MIYCSLKQIADTLEITPGTLQKILNRNPAFAELLKTRVKTNQNNAFAYPVTCIAFIREYLVNKMNAKAQRQKKPPKEKPKKEKVSVVKKKPERAIRKKPDTEQVNIVKQDSTFVLVDDFSVKLFLQNSQYSITLSRTEKYSVGFDSTMELKIKNTAIAVGVRIRDGQSIAYEKKSNQYVDSEGTPIAVAEEFGKITNEGQLIDFFNKYLNIVK